MSADRALGPFRFRTDLLLFYATPSNLLVIDTHFYNMCNFDASIEETTQTRQEIATNASSESAGRFEIHPKTIFLGNLLGKFR
jgi:hypothetical protein